MGVSVRYGRRVIRAALFDFGGVLLTSPFEAFADYERRVGVPVETIRRINSTKPDANAWARLERSESSVEEFVVEFEAEAEAFGHRLDGREVVACLAGSLRPEMVTALRRCAERLSTALLTNNIVSGDEEWSRGGSFAELAQLFDVVVESSVVGVRKPERRFYEIALAELGIEAHEAVFLDDLGINLKPAAEMGMTTIKVVDAVDAIAELESVVGFPLD